MRTLFILIASALCVVSLNTSAQAGTATLADGTLAASGNAQFGVGTFASLPSEFNIANGPLVFSGTLDPATAGTGDYNIGLTVGSVYFLIHPGFAGGAHRYDSFDVSNDLNSPNSNTGNLNIGFTPDASATDFLITLTDAGSGNFNVAVEISQGSNVSSLADAVLASSLFGTGGGISRFGVMHIGIEPNRGPLEYSNVMATMAPIPLPAALPLLLAALGGLGLAARRRTAA